MPGPCPDILKTSHLKGVSAAALDPPGLRNTGRSVTLKKGCGKAFWEICTKMMKQVNTIIILALMNWIYGVGTGGWGVLYAFLLNDSTEKDVL